MVLVLVDVFIVVGATFCQKRLDFVNVKIRNSSALERRECRAGECFSKGISLGTDSYRDLAGLAKSVKKNCRGPNTSGCYLEAGDLAALPSWDAHLQ
jgi:hypothetical protein